MTVSVREMLSEYAFEVQPKSWVEIVTFGCVLAGQQTVTASREHRSVGFVSGLELESLRLPDGYRQAIAAWQGD